MKIKLFTVPNIITLGNLFCGCMSVVMSFNNMDWAFYLILIAAVLDFCDGFAARMLKAYSEIGKQLDSLSDMVSFGVAPSMILLQMMRTSNTLSLSGADPSTTIWPVYIVFIVALFSALRLAKFNIDENQKDEFIGLPTPACAIFFASSGYLYANGYFSLQPWFILIVAVLFSYLLISPIRMFSLKFHNFSIKDNVIRYIFLTLSVALIAVCSIFTSPVAALPAIIAMYVLMSVCRNIAGYQSADN